MVTGSLKDAPVVNVRFHVEDAHRDALASSTSLSMDAQAKCGRENMREPTPMAIKATPRNLGLRPAPPK